MTPEQKAQIIATGDVPLALRMSQSEADAESVQRALAARKSGRFAGMSYGQVLAQLKQNRAEADAAED